MEVEVKHVRPVAATLPLTPDQRFLHTFLKDLGGDAQRVLSEVYSVPRVTEVARRLPHHDILPGFAMDLRTGWDFSIPSQRRKAKAMYEEQRPMFLVGSPPCTAFSTWQYLNNAKRPPEVTEAEWNAAVDHMEFVSELYAMQHQAGRYFLHEHPERATSWKIECIRRVASMQHVQETVCDQCQYGQEWTDGEPIKKGTRWLSNSQCILQALSRRCTGRGGHCSRPKGGRHREVSGAVAKKSQIYPEELCTAILRGCRKQLIEDGRLTIGIVGIQYPERDASDKELQRQCARYISADVEAMEVLACPAAETFKDSITRQTLRTDLVKAARREEMEYFVAKKVYQKAPREEAIRQQGKVPITVKWIDVNKGDDEKPKYRSRLVAREARRA